MSRSCYIDIFLLLRRGVDSESEKFLGSTTFREITRPFKISHSLLLEFSSLLSLGSIDSITCLSPCIHRISTFVTKLFESYIIKLKKLRALIKSNFNSLIHTETRNNYKTMQFIQDKLDRRCLCKIESLRYSTN